jgi:hypothetical protein
MSHVGVHEEVIELMHHDEKSSYSRGDSMVDHGALRESCRSGGMFYPGFVVFATPHFSSLFISACALSMRSYRRLSPLIARHGCHYEKYLCLNRFLGEGRGIEVYFQPGAREGVLFSVSLYSFGLLVVVSPRQLA